MEMGSLLKKIQEKIAFLKSVWHLYSYNIEINNVGVESLNLFKTVSFKRFIFFILNLSPICQEKFSKKLILIFCQKQ